MNTLAAMRESVFFEGPDARHRDSRFWMLLVLASIIASAGVVGDSTATVIGAMIVAPLMTPILGIVLATVLGSRRNLVRCWILVITGALCAIAIGYLVGLFVQSPIIAQTNSQVAGRISPHLIDLLAALATGVVGAVALVRKDISDTLPGVAIAISLVPPLCVVGLTMESGAWNEAGGALLLFATNVAAILGSGIVVLAPLRAKWEGIAAEDAATPARPYRALISIIVSLAIIAIPLASTSVRFTTDAVLESRVRAAAEPWADQAGWQIDALTVSGGRAELTLTGAPPLPGTDELTQTLLEAGVDTADVAVEFIPAYRVNLGDEPSD
ncbi:MULTISPECIES: DUF389 domain-containing protein [unclassified Microbacterium]|uniref:DUF389 domain-containing protein n=1 Tax=unclassified Microbacterium TaxID=2609290 RepID=UPI0012F77E1A|nr:DUF389 domain-containing protein [Microbacterium sp. MAH-37]MVQ41235.1 DUF389 domain-containing protein [Microbacterium sp. MAH-37]